jgi:EF hand domain-containing protein
MSQIQGSGSGSQALQWQYLQSIQPNTDPMLQRSAGDPLSFGLDPSSGGSGQTQPAGNGSGPTSLFSLGAMSALLDAQAQSSANGLSRDQQRVFGKLDADGDGKVSSAELQGAFGADNTNIANYVMGKLDSNGDGSISTDEFAAGTTRHAGHHHHMHMPQGGSQDAQNGQGTQGRLAQLLSADGASSSSSSNADGSTTTTITYADGSKVSMTSVASASGDGSTGSGTSNSSQQNLLEQLIKMQSQLIQSMSASASTSASLATI